MLLVDVVKTSSAVASTRSRLRKIAFLADCLRRLSPAETGIGAAWLSRVPCARDESASARRYCVRPPA